MQAHRRDVEKPWQLVRSGFHSVEHSAQDLFYRTRMAGAILLVSANGPMADCIEAESPH
jgi:hypothetical protein